jgi:hypothetical protein
VHSDCTTQVALVLGGLLGQDVTLEGLTALDGTTWTNAETLFRAALGLHFGHMNAPFFIVLVRRLQTDLQTCWPRATFTDGFRHLVWRRFRPAF